MSWDTIPITFQVNECDLYIDAMWEGRRIGHLWCTITGKRLKIDDLVVDDHFQIPPRTFESFYSLLGIPRKVISFRRRGIGSDMLDRLIVEASALGVEEVWGSVVEKDVNRSASLLRWYEHRGFTILEPDDECMLAAVKKISRRIQSNE